MVRSVFKKKTKKNKAKVKRNIVMRRLRPSHTHCANQKPNGSVETVHKQTAQTQLPVKLPPMLFFVCSCRCIFWGFCFPALPALFVCWLVWFFFHRFLIDGFGDVLLQVQTQAVLICTASCRKTHRTGPAGAGGSLSSSPSAAQRQWWWWIAPAETSSNFKFNNQESDGWFGKGAWTSIEDPFAIFRALFS